MHNFTTLNAVYISIIKIFECYNSRLSLHTHTISIQFQCLSYRSWWRHQMEIFSALLAICVGNSPVPGEFPTQRPVTRSFDVYFDLRPNKRVSKQSLGWWFETLSPPLWRHRNVLCTIKLHERIQRVSKCWLKTKQHQNAVPSYSTTMDVSIDTFYWKWSVATT